MSFTVFRFALQSGNNHDFLCDSHRTSDGVTIKDGNHTCRLQLRKTINILICAPSAKRLLA